MIGQTVLHYKILSKLGSGGMGDVYLALDTRLQRQVALKFLPDRLSLDAEARSRLHREARAASRLNHPNILTVFAVEEFGERDFIAAEYIDGKPLTEYWQNSEKTWELLADLISQAAQGLARAHQAGIVHRDIKPQNMLVDTEGQVKILDFGLAKLKGATQLTKETSTLGTIQYMSPEQARGDEVDLRSDIWSLGAVMYELLTGVTPFRGDYQDAIIYNILHEQPSKPTAINSSIPPQLEHVCLRALSKEPEARYESMDKLLADLADYRASLLGDASGSFNLKYAARQLRRPRYAIPAVLLVGALIAATAWWLNRQSKINWARQVALPEILRLQAAPEDSLYGAFRLACEAEKYIPNDTLLKQVWPDIARYSSLTSDPPGARVYRKPYLEPEREWEFLGTTPLDSIRNPLAYMRVKVEKEGYFPENFTIEGSNWGRGAMVLDSLGSIPDSMAYFGTGEYRIAVSGMPQIGNVFGTVLLDDFLIDRYEVTNRKFKRFVDSGGYLRPEYWKHPFKKDGTDLSWDEAMDLFKDKTARPGPSTWEIGSYPYGEEDYPVTGVSWYEAAAYAEFMGRSLPTIYHWYVVADTRYHPAETIALSNISGRAMAKVGSFEGLTTAGVYDMAGNAREWCSNDMDGRRPILGGAWNDPDYGFMDLMNDDPLDRNPVNGFRCVKYLAQSDTLEQLKRPVKLATRDYSAETPVNDDVFQIYLNQFAYDPAPLNSRLEDKAACTTDYRTEFVSFDAAYGGERMMAVVILPNDVPPPYQTVIFFPGSNALYGSSVCDVIPWEVRGGIGFVLKSGRAFVYPIYSSTFERGGRSDYVEPPANSHLNKELTIRWARDLHRCVDYLEARDDIDMTRLAYYGLSWGGIIAPIMLATEPRLKTAVLNVAGLLEAEYLPEVDPFNYLPRVRMPVIMINARYDVFFTIESQKAMFGGFGTPPEHKKLVLLETDHLVPRNVLIGESLKWLDTYLGPVQAAPAGP